MRGQLDTRDICPLLESWLERLGGKRSAYAIQRPDGRYYSVHRPLTPSVVKAHLEGRLTLGIYLLDEQDHCRCVVIDADQPDGLLRLATLQQTLAQEGIHSSLEQSRRGGHLWMWLAQPTPAGQVRAWLRPLCPGLEIYPRQDAAPGGYGSLIRLPFGVHRRSGQRYDFVVIDPSGLRPVAEGVHEQLMWWLAQPSIHPPALTAVTFPRQRPGDWQRDDQQPGHSTGAAPAQSYSLPSVRPSLVNIASPVLAWCLARNPYEVIGRYVALDGRGVGRCPFGSHHRAGVDRHPSFKVFWHTPAGNCWYCYTWGHGGSLFDFFRFLWRVDPRTAYDRLIVQGEEV